MEPTRGSRCSRVCLPVRQRRRPPRRAHQNRPEPVLVHWRPLAPASRSNHLAAPISDFAFSYGLADVVAVDSSHQPPWRHTVTYSRLEFRDASMDPYAHALQHVGITRHREAHAPASESGENLIALLTQSDIISALVARTCRGI